MNGNVNLDMILKKGYPENPQDDRYRYLKPKLGHKQENNNGRNRSWIFLKKEIDSVPKDTCNYYISGENKKDICDSHAHIVHLYKKCIDQGIFISGQLTV